MATAWATVRVRLAAEAERAIADWKAVILMWTRADGTKRGSAGDDTSVIYTYKSRDEDDVWSQRGDGQPRLKRVWGDRKCADLNDWIGNQGT
jgi:hypothetical protein